MKQNNRTFFKVLFLTFVVGFIFCACEGTQYGISPEDTISTPTFLKFTNASEMVDYLIDQGDYEIPADFVSLEDVLNEKIKAYNETDDLKFLQGYYTEEGSVLKPAYKFLSLAKVLNKDHIIEVGGRFYKFDEDGVKTSLQNSIEELLAGINLDFIKSEVHRVKVADTGVRAKCVILYADFVDVFGLFVASLHADVLYSPGFEMRDGSFTCDGGWLGASLVNRTTFGSISKGFGYSDTWSQGIASWTPTCNDHLIQLHFTDAIFQCYVVDPLNNPLDPVCGVYLTPVFYAEAIDPCP